MTRPKTDREKKAERNMILLLVTGFLALFWSFWAIAILPSWASGISILLIILPFVFVLIFMPVDDF